MTKRGISDLRAVAFVALAGFAAHGLVLLTDYTLWDGWGYYHWLKQPGEHRHLQRLFHEIGRPLDFLMVTPFIGFLAVNVLAKVAGVITWIASACLMYLVLRRAQIALGSVALACAAIAVTLPVFDVLGELSIWMNTASVALFWGGWLLLLSLPAHSGSRWLMRLGALAVFFLAFNLNSQLVFYYAFAVCVVVLPRCQEGLGPILGAARRALLRFPDFAVLPVVFWIWKRLFTPNSGYYLDYNSPTLSPEVFVRGGRSLVEGVLQGELVGLFDSAIWLALCVIVLGLFALLADRGGLVWPSVGSPAEGGALFCGGFFLLLAGAFPYGAVDQSFSSFGWLTRNCILFPLPLGMMIVGGACVIGGRLAPHRPGLTWIALAMIGLLAVGSSNRATLRWQAFGAKQLSIMAKLQPAFEDNPPALVQLRDYFLLPQTIQFYPPIVWTFMLARGLETPRTFVLETAQIAPDQVVAGADGQPQRQVSLFGVDEPSLDAAIEQTTVPYALTAIPRHGRQVLAIVEPGSLGADAISLGWEYLWRRWFHRAELPEWLDRLTAVRIEELPPIPPAGASAPQGSP